MWLAGIPMSYQPEQTEALCRRATFQSDFISLAVSNFINFCCILGRSSKYEQYLAFPFSATFYLFYLHKHGVVLVTGGGHAIAGPYLKLFDNSRVP